MDAWMRWAAVVVFWLVLGAPSLRAQVGEAEDQPAIVGVDVVPAEHVPQHRSELFGLGGVEDGVGPDDAHGVDPRRPLPRPVAGGRAR